MSLTESQARRVISDIHKSLSGRALNSQSVRNYLDQWLAARTGTVAPATLKEYQSTVTGFLEHLKARAEVDLAFITPTDIVGFRDLSATRLSPGSVNKKLKIIRVAFQQAWRDGMIEQNPASKVLFGLYTGQRLGDLARVRWENLDLERMILSLTTRKTRRRQILPLAKPLLAWLKSWPRAAGDGPIFPLACKIAERHDNVGLLSNQFNDLLAAAGIIEKRTRSRKTDGEGRSARRVVSDLSFHSLRHTATSLMKNSGISSAIVQEFVGHDSKEISQNYTHIETESMRLAADSLPDLYIPS